MADDTLDQNYPKPKRKLDPFATVVGSEIQRSPVDMIVFPIIHKVLCILNCFFLDFFHPGYH